MPVSLNTFQQAVNSSDLTGYIKLSPDKSSVKSYDAGFFARHFHTYSSRDENREVRRAFYDSITSSYKCSESFCASLRKELGIDSGSHKALSIKDANDILQRVKIESRILDSKEATKDPISLGQPFARTSNSFFQKYITDKYTTTLARADNTTIPTYEAAFSQCFDDYDRPGIGLKVGNEVIAYVDDSCSDTVEARTPRNAAMAAKLKNFFEQDTTNGMRAARIIGDITHQSCPQDILKGLIASKDPVVSPFAMLEDNNISAIIPLTFAMNFSVDRSSNGSYNIHFSGNYNPQIFMSTGSTGSSMTLFDSKNSLLSYDMDLVLSFDPNDGKPKIELTQPLKISGKLSPVTLENGDSIDPTMIGGCKDYVEDGGDGTDYVAMASNEGKINDREISRALFQTHDMAYLRDNITTESDLKLLTLFNFPTGMEKKLMTGLGLDDSVPRLNKETFKQLLSSDPAERNKGLQKLNDMLTAYDNLGLRPPDQRLRPNADFRPEILNLVTIAKLSHIPPNSDSPSDAKLVADHMRQSNDPNHQRMLSDLGSSDQAKVDAAKADIQKLLSTLKTAATTTTTTTTTTTGSVSDPNAAKPDDATPPPPTNPQATATPQPDAPKQPVDPQPAAPNPT